MADDESEDSAVSDPQDVGSAPSRKDGTPEIREPSTSLAPQSNDEPTNVKLLEYVDKAPKEIRPRLASLVVRESSIFSGPLPPPKMLADYETLYPGAAKQILASAEREQKHRHGLDDRELAIYEREMAAQARDRRLGMLCALCVSMAFLAVSGALIWAGHDWAGGLLGTLDIVALAGIFLQANHARKKAQAADDEEPRPSPQRQNDRKRLPKKR